MENNAKKVTLTVTVDKSEILYMIYANSASHCRLHKERSPLTPDVERAVTLAVGEGFADMRARMGGYFKQSNFNPNVEENAVSITAELHQPPKSDFAADLKDTVKHLLVYFALSRFYDGGDYYRLAWRKYRAQLPLIFARDANFDILRE